MYSVCIKNETGDHSGVCCSEQVSSFSRGKTRGRGSSPLQSLLVGCSFLFSSGKWTSFLPKSFFYSNVTGLWFSFVLCVCLFCALCARHSNRIRHFCWTTGRFEWQPDGTGNPYTPGIKGSPTVSYSSSFLSILSLFSLSLSLSLYAGRKYNRPERRHKNHVSSFFLFEFLAVFLSATFTKDRLLSRLTRPSFFLLK